MSGSAFTLLTSGAHFYCYRALRRKIGGTKQDFWKEWVDVKGDYTDKGYVDKAEGIIGLPFLIVVVLGVFGALAYVVSQTSAVPTPPVG